MGGAKTKADGARKAQPAVDAELLTWPYADLQAGNDVPGGACYWSCKTPSIPYACASYAYLMWMHCVCADDHVNTLSCVSTFQHIILGQV